MSAIRGRLAARLRALVPSCAPAVTAVLLAFGMLSPVTSLLIDGALPGNVVTVSAVAICAAAWLQTHQLARALKAAREDAERATALDDLPAGAVFHGGPMDGAEWDPCSCGTGLHLPALIIGPGGSYRRVEPDHVVWAFEYTPAPAPARGGAA